MNKKPLFLMFVITGLFIFMSSQANAAMTDGLIGSWNFTDGSTVWAKSNLGSAYNVSVSSSAWVPYGYSSTYNNTYNSSTSNTLAMTTIINATSTSDITMSWCGGFTGTGNNGASNFILGFHPSGQNKFTLGLISNASADQYSLAQWDGTTFSYSTTALTADKVIPTNPNTYTCFVLIKRYASNEVNFYKNGTLINNFSMVSRGFTGANTIYFYRSVGWNNQIVFNNFNIWNRTLNNSEIIQLNYRTDASFYPFVMTNTSYITFTAKDESSLTTLNNFSVNFTDLGIYYSTTNGTIQTNVTTGTYNLTFASNQSGGYFNKTYANANASLSFNATLFQVEVRLNATQKATNAPVSGANFSSWSQQNTTLYLKAGQNNITATGTGYFSSTQSFTYTALQNTTETFTNMYNLQLNLSAYDVFNGSIINNINANVTYLNYSNYSEFYTTTNGTLYLQLLNGSYVITINSNQTNAYATKQVNLTYSTGSYAYNTTMYKSNSITMIIYNQTSLLNTSNQTISIVMYCTNSTYYSNTTTTGSIYYEGLPAGQCNVTASGTGYSSNTYTINIGAYSYQTLDIYLPPSSSTNVVFLVQNAQDSTIIPDATFNIYTQINGSYILTNTYATDITGRIQFTYVANTNYRFTVIKSGYSDKFFSLSPIIFSDYTVNMEPSTVTNLTADFSGVFILRSAQTAYYVGNNSSYNITVSSPDGELAFYSLKVTLPNTSSYTTSGTNAYGGFLPQYFNITSATISDYININISYIKSDDGITHTYTYNLPLSFNSSRGLVNLESLQGLPLFDGLIISIVILIIFTVLGYTINGIGSAVIGQLAGYLLIYNLNIAPASFFYVSIVLSVFLLMTGER